MLPVLAANGPSGYNLTNSLRFRSSASAYLSRTPASASNQTTWTWSGWVKRGTFGNQTLFGYVNNTGTIQHVIYFNGDTIDFRYYNSAMVGQLATTQVFRDPSAWYHIVAVWDTTQATAANRMKLYVNGVQVTAFSTTVTPAQNTSGYVNTTVLTNIGAQSLPNASYFDGYMTEVNFIDGQALTPSSFGSTNALTGVWQPKAYTGTYGTNGFYLNFSNIALTSGSNTGLGKDYSGNGNYWNTNNISVTAGTTYDAMTDVPTLTSATVANYCVANPLDVNSNITISNANLTWTKPSEATTWRSGRSTIFPASGKWYWEETLTSFTDQSHNMFGIASNAMALTSYLGASNDACGIQWQSGSSNVSTFGIGNVGAIASGTTLSAGDIIGVAYDADSGKLFLAKNNTWINSGNPVAGTGYTHSGAISGFAPAFGMYSTGATTNINFGQRPFTYTPPTGYVALNTYNLPTSTIVKGNKYMDINTWTGNASSQTIVNSGGFSPDFVWVKGRSFIRDHFLFDTIRGADNWLNSSNTAAEAGGGNTLTAFNSNGFSMLGSDAVNGSSNTYVGWQWDAGSSTVTNTSGSISSQVRANTTAGFSIVTYTGNGSTTGATVGHGLGVAPKMIIVKNRTRADNWLVQTASTGATGYLNLDGTGAFVSSARAWNNTAPTSSVFTVNTFAGETWSNRSGDTYVAYCWAAISGFSAFGSWTGNGSSDGPMIYLGFQPKFIMWKRTDSSTGGEWVIQDTTRKTYNPIDTSLYPNLANAEGTNETFRVQDTLSNGFKIRASAAQCNASGGTYIYAAFASNPFRNSNAF